MACLLIFLFPRSFLIPSLPWRRDGDRKDGGLWVRRIRFSSLRFQKKRRKLKEWWWVCIIELLIVIPVERVATWLGVQQTAGMSVSVIVIQVGLITDQLD